VFDSDPLKVARRWAEAGAAWLHVVNLDGAFGDDAGAAAKNRALLKPLCEIGLRVQFGGGVRSMTDIEAVLTLGVERVILGTIAIEQPEIVVEAIETFGAKYIVVGLDARNGQIKTRGWQLDGGIDVISIGRQLRSSGVELVVHTDIGRDGVLSGVNASASIELARETGLKVIASGGVSSIEDVIGLKNKPEIEGVIIGRALYTGSIDLHNLLNQLR
jgi:phosphoribosylformimino-5-aminoimidazole carboxamide ribotide isomerase